MPKVDDILNKKPFQKKTRRAWDMHDPLAKFSDKIQIENTKPKASIDSMDAINNMDSIKHMDTIDPMVSIEKMDTITSMDTRSDHLSIDSMESINLMEHNPSGSIITAEINKKLFPNNGSIPRKNEGTIDSVDSIESMDTTISMDSINYMDTIENMGTIESMDVDKKRGDSFTVVALFFQNLTALNLSAREFRVLLHISRLTSCKPDNFVWITNAQFETELNISPKTLYLAMGTLLGKKLIHRKFVLRPNKNFYALSSLLFQPVAKREFK